MTDKQASALGALIRVARHRKRLSLHGLAEQTGYDYSWLHRLESGQYTSPNPMHLVRIAEALDIDPARIDRVSRDHLANSMPGVRTYFRSTQKLSPEALDEIERTVDEIRAKHAKPSTDNTTTKGGTP